MIKEKWNGESGFWRKQFWVEVELLKIKILYIQFFKDPFPVNKLYHRVILNQLHELKWEESYSSKW